MVKERISVNEAHIDLRAENNLRHLFTPHDRTHMRLMDACASPHLTYQQCVHLRLLKQLADKGL